VSGHASPAVVLGPRPGPAISPFASSFRLVQHPAIMLPAAPMLYPNVAPSPATALVDRHRQLADKKRVITEPGVRICQPFSASLVLGYIV
jgi:hypothetical protein